MEAREASIVAQVAAKAAADLCSGTGDTNAYLDAVETIHNDLVDRIGTGAPAASAPVAAAPAPVAVAPISIAQEQAASNVVTGAFPGSEAQYVPGPPQVITADSKGTALWEDAVYHHPADWKVWRSDKSSASGGRAPDVSHENVENNGNKLAFWLVDSKYPNKSAPKWVWDGLGLQAEWQANLAQGKVQA